MTSTCKTLLRSLSICMAFLLASSSAFATHLRGTTVSWSPTGVAGQVQFTVQYSQRQSFGGCSQAGCPVGSTLPVGFSFGDGTTGSFTTTVTSVNTAEDYLSSTGTLTHTYTSAGPFTAFYQASARVSTIKSGHDQLLRMQTIVSPFASPANHSPVVSEPAIITLPFQNTTGFFISASDLDRDTLSYRLATATEMYDASGFSCSIGQPPGLSVNSSTGQVTWDTTQIVKAGCGYTAPVSGDLWTVQFEVSDLDAAGKVKSTVPLDIILKFVSSTEAPPTLTLSNPGPITVQAGTPITFTATGNDAAANSRITLNATGLPVGATSSNLNSALAPAVVSTFDWTPTASQVGSYVITYSATNDTFEQVLASVTIYVQNIQPPVLSCSAPITAQYNMPISIPLTVSDPQADAVTVSWYLDGTLVKTDNVPAFNSTTSLSLSETFTTLGAHTVSVSATDTDGKTSTCSTQVTVTKADQTISFGALPASKVGSSDIALSATSSSGLAVTYSATGACTIINGAVHITGAGTCSVTASQAGNAMYNAASNVTQILTIAKGDQVITFNPPATATYGNAPITLAATGGASNDPITYTVTGPATVSGNVLTITGAGDVVVTAHQAGNTDYNAAADAAKTIVVSKAAQAITFNPPASVTYGVSPITLAATGGASNSPITYTVTGPATVSGNVLTITGAGNVVVTAHQAGNANYSAAADVAKTIVVGKAAQAITFNPPASVTYGVAPITLAATGGASNNPITYTVTGPATINGNVLTITGAGNVVVTAHQAGNANYNAAPDMAKTIVVNKAPQAITFNPQAQVSAYSNITLSATGGASGNPVTYTVTGPATVSGNVLTVTGPGTVVVTADQAGNANYATAVPLVRSIIAKVTATVTLSASSTTLNYPNSTNLKACVKLANGLTATGTISIYDGTTLITTQKVQGDGCIYPYLSPNPSAGSHTLTAYYNDPQNANIFSNLVTIKVNPGVVTTEVDCWVHDAPYGGDIKCDANPDSGPTSGYMVYSYDNGPLVPVQMNSASHAVFTIPKPLPGTHTIQITYPAQGNWSASALPLQVFHVAQAPTYVALTPSTWYTTAGKAVTLNVAITSTSTSAPNAVGTVSFYDGGKLLGTSAVTATGTASFNATALAAGTHAFTATYSGYTDLCGRHRCGDGEHR